MHLFRSVFDALRSVASVAARASPLSSHSMAAALSRALKLPGKKGTDLGEYDPLTQADSEDEIEEDDLVLNYPRNGLSPELRGRQCVDEEEFDEDEWRVQGQQPQRERVGLEPEGTGLGRGQGGDSEEKAVRVRGAVQTAAFLLPLSCAAVLVLLCAFLIPCPQGALHNTPRWETELGDVGGVTSPPVALWDVDGDGLDDVLIGVTNISNDSQPMSSQSKEYSVMAVSGISGQVLWRRVLREPLISLQCGLQTGSADPHYRELETSACILISSSHIISVNASTGRTFWTAAVGNVESHAVLLPDLQGDAFPELLITTLPADQVSDLALVLISGRSGALIGRPVNFNLTAQGKLIGPLLHETATGAYYILFGLGTVEAVSLSYIYSQATGRTASSRVRLKDPNWERLRKNNTTLIHISSGAEQVEFLLPLVAGLCHNHNNLDTVSVLNASRSDWILVCGVNSRLSVLKQSDTHAAWTLSLTSIHSRPVSGHFNDDGVPDVLIDQSANGIRKVQIIDGTQGRSLWEAEFVCPRLAVEDSSVLTTSGQSVFLFWAGDPLTQSQNVTKAAAAEPVQRKLFLLHPYYPTILLQLSSTTDTVLTATVSYQSQQKDASYISVSSRPTSSLGLGNRLLKSFSMKAAIAAGQIVQLGDVSRDVGAFHINKFFRRLSFKQ
ncbi:protein FAM234B isoform X2 [Myxocyprinus asiaticus]|nr:protein FAM234B isoform X2 [Myxocyprinus asiaticus]